MPPNLLAYACHGQNRQFEGALYLLFSMRLSWKLIWEVFRARESPHQNFSSNAWRIKDIEPPQNGDFGVFQKIGKNRLFAKCGQKRHFWCVPDFLRVLDRFFSRFWPRTCSFNAKTKTFKIWKFGVLAPSRAFFPKVGQESRKKWFSHVLAKTCF